MNIKELPDLDYADPIRLTGKKGQIAASTTALIHAGSRNVSDKPRKLLTLRLLLLVIICVLMLIDEDKRLKFLKELREKFNPQRRYILDSTIHTLTK